MKTSNFIKAITGTVLIVLAHAGTVKAQNVDSIRVTMLVTLHVKPGYKEAFIAALRADKDGALKETGNISMALYKDRDKPDTLFLFERWENQAALDEHFKKSYTQNAFKVAETALASPLDITYLNDIAPLPKNQIKEHTATDVPVDLVCVFTVKDSQQATFVNQFRKSIANSRSETGNVNFFFHSVPADNTKFVLYERWRNEAALQKHFNEPYTKELFDMFTRTLPEPVLNYLHYLVEIK